MDLKKVLIGTLTMSCLLGPAALYSYAEEYQNSDHHLDQTGKNLDRTNNKLEYNINTTSSKTGVQDGWSYKIQNGYAVLEGYSGSQKDIIIPGEIKGVSTLFDLSNAVRYFPFDISSIKTITFTEKNGNKAIPGRIKIGLNKEKKVEYDYSLNFQKFQNLESLDARGLDTSKVTSFNSCFKSSPMLSNVIFDGCDTSNVTDFSYMFANCANLKSASFKNWNTQNVTRMNQMFFGCGQLEKLDLSSFFTPNLEEIEQMFSGCGATFIRLDNFDTAAVYNKNGIFDNTINGKELLVVTRDRGLLNYSYPGRVSVKAAQFTANGGKFADNSTVKNYIEQCAVTPEKLTLTEFNKFKDANIPINSGFGGKFLGWQKEESEQMSTTSTLDSSLDTYIAKWENTNWEFEENDTNIVLTKYKGSSNEVIVPTTFNGKKIILKDLNKDVIPSRITKFSVDDTTQNKLSIQDTNLESAFEGNANLREVDFSGVDTSNITKLDKFFKGCTNLQKVNFSNCNTSQVNSMASMFQNCRSLTEVDFSNVNTQSLSNVQFMFNECPNLKVIDLSSFNFPNILNDEGMFTTTEKTELLILTSDKKLQDMNYDRYNRVPLDGPVFKTNGGQLDNNAKEKKYFEKCAYDPSIVTMEKFNEFKKQLVPVRRGFAPNFVTWEPKNIEKQSPNSVLDLINATYEAKWSDPNWEFTETSDTITLTKYIGESTEVFIPGEIDGKNVAIVDFNRTVIPQTITKLKIKEQNRKKVKFTDDSFYNSFSDYQNLTEVDLSGLDSSLVINMEKMFLGCVNLVKVNLNGLDTSKVTKFIDTFKFCKKLKEANVSELDTSNVTNMTATFYDCDSLSTLDISNWDTSNVTTTAKMFLGAGIEYIDMRNWNTPKLMNTNRMFNGCTKLRVARMDNFDIDMSNMRDYTAMFYTTKNREILIVTSDEDLLTKYNYNNDHANPLSKPVLDANGGKFKNNASTIKYFEKSAVSPQVFKTEVFEKFKNANIPTKENAVFRGWKRTTTSDVGIPEELNSQYTAIWKYTNCNTTSDNKKITTSGNIGFVYMPEEMIISETKLADTGKQEIPFNKNQSFNIGVRDLSQNMSSSWNVTGQLKWSGPDIPGAYIQIDSNQNSIKKNTNDNVASFNADRDLVVANGEVKSCDTEDGHLLITNESANKLMESVPNKMHDDIYDYNLGNASLIIPKTEFVPKGSYAATIEWNLNNTPQ